MAAPCGNRAKFAAFRKVFSSLKSVNAFWKFTIRCLSSSLGLSPFRIADITARCAIVRYFLSDRPLVLTLNRAPFSKFAKSFSTPGIPCSIFFAATASGSMNWKSPTVLQRAQSGGVHRYLLTWL